MNTWQKMCYWMHSYIIQTCGERNDRKTVSSNKIHIYRLSAVGIYKDIHWATSAPKWPEVASPHSSFFISSNPTWQRLLHLFSSYNQKLKTNRSRWMARDKLIYGRDRLFRWPLLNVRPADTVNHKIQGLQISPQSSLVSTSCQSIISGPYPGQPSFLLWIKDSGAEVGKDRLLALPPLFSPCTLSLPQWVPSLSFSSPPSSAFIRLAA